MNTRFGIGSIIAIVAALALWTAPSARADEVVAQASPAPSASPSPTPPPKPFTLTGYADASFQSAKFSTNDFAQYPLTNLCGLSTLPTTTPCPNTISGRVFDYLNNQVQFHTFNLIASLLPQPVGFTVEFNGGDDANIINSYPKNVFAPGTDLDLTQAYISLASGQFTGIVGKFETLAGAEVIESPNDWNISRSILFGFAIPFTHTGGRLTWAPNSNISVMGGVNKGWDTTGTNVNDGDNQSLTFEAGVNATVGNLNIVLDGYGGHVEEGYWQVNSIGAATYGFTTVNTYNPTAAGLGATCDPYVLTGAASTAFIGGVNCAPGFAYNVGAIPTRSLIDSTLTYKAGAKLTLKLNPDWGWQTNTGLVNSAGVNYGYGTATWFGTAGYAIYDFNSQWQAALRGEYFYDGGGSRTGFTQSWSEFTATAQYSPVSEVILRAEFRGDHSTVPFFFNGQFPALPMGYVNNYQFGVEAIGRFP